MVEVGLRTTVIAGATAAVLAHGSGAIAAAADLDDEIIGLQQERVQESVLEAALAPDDAGGGVVSTADDDEGGGVVSTMDDSEGGGVEYAADDSESGGVEYAAAAGGFDGREFAEVRVAAAGHLADTADIRNGIELLGDGPNYLEIGIGAFDLLEEHASSRRSGGGSVELRGGNKLWYFGPAAGVVFNTDGGVYGYGGIYADVQWGPVVLTPQAGIGAYHQGDSADLGGVFQFRIGAGLSYQLVNGWRIGLSFAHISNAGIYDDNGGVEEVYLIVALPFSL